MDPAILARIAALESELAGYRKSNHTAPQGPTPEQLRAQILAEVRANPFGFVEAAGVPRDYLAKASVAQIMGDQAPAHIREEVARGPQIFQAAAPLANDVASLRQETAAIRQQLARESLKNIATDKTKYPHLSTTYAANPALIEAELAAGGSADEIAARLEGKLAEYAKVFAPPKQETPPASQATADTSPSATSQQATGAITSVTPGAGDPPPLPRATSVGFSETDAKALRDEIVRNYDAGKYKPVTPI